MFGSTIVDVGIGLIIVYLTLSLVCSAANELLASLLSVRARMLKAGVKRILSQDPKAIQTFFGHPLVRSVAPNDAPSYISSAVFAAVLLDTVVDLTEKAPQEVTELHSRVGDSQVIGEDLKRSLRTLLVNTKDVASAQAALANWFDEAMARVSGTYKRFTHATVFLVGVCVCALANADTLAIANTLWKNGALRARLVDASGAAISAGAMADPTGSVQTLLGMDLLGWGSVHGAVDPVQKIVGIAITAFAVSLGAPFWFDLLSRFVRVRATGAKPEWAVFRQ